MLKQKESRSSTAGDRILKLRVAAIRGMVTHQKEVSEFLINLEQPYAFYPVSVTSKIWMRWLNIRHVDWMMKLYGTWPRRWNSKLGKQLTTSRHETNLDGIFIDVACILFIPSNPDELQSQCGRKWNRPSRVLFIKVNMVKSMTRRKNSKASRYWQNQKEAYWATDLKEYRIRSKTLEEFSKMRIRFKLGGESEDESWSREFGKVRENVLGISRGIQSWRSQGKSLRRRSELGGELNLLLSRV